ncbi:NACHT domain-containing protein [Adhaeribacter soli]|uniref:Uncharacterized protein n=1 Tax=Adhaeribacter soli TaxID=2607655 RepID=A0A5N1IWT8_9BACT|nr:hypothetical protein [Adhaeribacter soli]KAA9338790.1 hypothetical protein F0P94_08310 [Adhaeribacter soli]
MPKNYPWQRRWLITNPDPAATTLPYELDNDGYVLSSKFITSLTAEPIGVTLDQLDQDLKCAVLLGEPGIGKSFELNKQRALLIGLPDHLFLDLGSVTTEDVLYREVMHSSKVELWLKVDSILTLWLDSLDEGLLHISKLQEAILRILRKLPIERLRLRITCRNAVWPSSFSEVLKSLWNIKKDLSSQQFAILLLSPLTQEQVREAVSQEGFNSDLFLAAIAQVDAQPLASSPVTLQLLINLYKTHQPNFGISETSGRAGLYERGCLELCELPDRTRNESHRGDPRSRLLLAGYLAFLAVLTNRRQIHIEPVSGILGPNELDPYVVGAGHTVTWNGTKAQITAATVRDLLRNTGLFTDVANGRMVWTHQSYAEFLAAWYLNLTQLPHNSLRPLFRSATDPTGGIVPALKETVAWLAELQPAFWHEILALDPMALVRSDLR